MRAFIVTNITLLAAFNLSCSPPIVVGISNCNVYVLGDELNNGAWPDQADAGQSFAWSMELYNQMESVAVDVLNTTTDSRLHDACRRLGGTSVTIKREQVWTDMRGESVVGQSWCGNPSLGVRHEIHLNNSWPPGSSIAHEYAHILQGCLPGVGPNLKLEEDAQHAGWHDAGIYDALDLYFDIQYEKYYNP